MTAAAVVAFGVTLYFALKRPRGGAGAAGAPGASGVELGLGRVSVGAVLRATRFGCWWTAGWPGCERGASGGARPASARRERHGPLRGWPGAPPEELTRLGSLSETLSRLAPLPEVFVSTPSLAPRLGRELKAGRARELAPGLYTTDVTEAPESLVRRLLWPIASLVFPRAVITDRTAFEARPSADGSVFLAADAARDVVLPGAVFRARKGCWPLAGDTPFLALHIASRARLPREHAPLTRASARTLAS